MKKTIFTVYVPITEGQTQCNRLKQICIDNDLPYWDSSLAFNYDNLTNDDVFSQAIESKHFFIMPLKGNDDNFKGKTQVTEAEFIELLKQEKDVSK